MSSCSDIAESIDILERAILKQPYYGLHLEFDRGAEKAPLDGPVSSVVYEHEKKRLGKEMKSTDN